MSASREQRAKVHQTLRNTADTILSSTDFFHVDAKQTCSISRNVRARCSPFLTLSLSLFLFPTCSTLGVAANVQDRIKIPRGIFSIFFALPSLRSKAHEGARRARILSNFYGLSVRRREVLQLRYATRAWKIVTSAATVRQLREDFREYRNVSLKLHYAERFRPANG